MYYTEGGISIILMMKYDVKQMYFLMFYVITFTKKITADNLELTAVNMQML